MIFGFTVIGPSLIRYLPVERSFPPRFGPRVLSHGSNRCYPLLINGLPQSPTRLQPGGADFNFAAVCRSRCGRDGRRESSLERRDVNKSALQLAHVVPVP